MSVLATLALVALDPGLPTQTLSAFWRSARVAYAAIRRMVFTKPRPDGPYIVVARDVAPLEAALGARCFRPNWMFSYNFRGENVNLARAFHDGQSGYNNVEWWQTHVRGWVHADGLLYLTAHHEPEPTEHPDAHTQGVGYDRARGMAALGDALTDANIPIRARIERIDPAETGTGVDDALDTES